MGSTRDEGEVLQVFRRGGKRPGDLAWRRERQAKICSHPISFPAQVFIFIISPIFVFFG